MPIHPLLPLKQVRECMRHYVNTTSAYLLQGGCDYTVRAVYL